MGKQVAAERERESARERERERARARERERERMRERVCGMAPKHRKPETSKHQTQRRHSHVGFITCQESDMLVCS